MSFCTFNWTGYVHTLCRCCEAVKISGVGHGALGALGALSLPGAGSGAVIRAVTSQPEASMTSAHPMKTCQECCHVSLSVFLSPSLSLSLSLVLLSCSLSRAVSLSSLLFSLLSPLSFLISLFSSVQCGRVMNGRRHVGLF